MDIFQGPNLFALCCLTAVKCVVMSVGDGEVEDMSPDCLIGFGGVVISEGGGRMLPSFAPYFPSAITFPGLLSLTDYRCVNTLLKSLLRGGEMA